MTVNSRKGELHFKRKLKDGQIAHLWMTRYWENNSYYWNVGLFIGDTDKQARLWYSGKKTFDITGLGNTEGIFWAIKMVGLCANLLPNRDTIIINGQDGRRARLYLKLVKREVLKFEKEDWRSCTVKCQVWEEE